MANLSRNFVSGKMNKVLDERVVPNGEYIDALNIRMGSTENAEIGVIENSKGNEKLSDILYVDGTPVSINARCIGAFADSLNEKVYWFVHDPSFTVGATGKLDLIVSYDTNASILTYHIVSVDDGGGTNTTLNFNNRYLITGVNKIDDLIFFTDDYNQPRFFNVNRVYLPPSGNIDQFSAESILVIKKPPVESPSINPTTVAGQENFLEENFICFAYRYRYSDGEYSATSQWSEPAFVPNPFDIAQDSFLNSGMISNTNACQITYNSGGPLVIGIDLLYKAANSNIIKVIEKINKVQGGLSDNTNYTYLFVNSKIYTILPESELFRLYDNVPLFAKAQTLMGNRLMYGNYVEGYDLIDKNNEKVNLEYEASLVSQEVSSYPLNTVAADSTYGVDGALLVQDSKLNIDFTSVINSPEGFKAGALLTIDVSLEHEAFSNQTPPITSTTTQLLTVSFSYQLTADYAPSAAGLAALVSDPSFIDAIGTISNIQPVSNAQNGTKFTDVFNAAIPNTLTLIPSNAPYYKYESGILNPLPPNEPILVTSSGNIMSIQFPAMKFVDDTTTPTDFFFEYYKIMASDALYQPLGVAKSLHSNRDYDIGIVYMDEFNRSTTALVSSNNTVYVPCSNSDLKNSIQVSIPASQIAPSWATRYKFVIKPNAEGYETIYTTLYYPDPIEQNYVWFFLQGENEKKVEIGDRYIVKSDSNGPLDSCGYATVLDKDVKGTNQLATGSPDGVYMKMLPTDFSAVLGSNSVYTVYDSEQCSDGGSCNNDINGSYAPLIALNIFNQPVPAGAKVDLYFYWKRNGTGNFTSCEKRTQEYRGTFLSTANYPDFKAWWDGDNIENTLNSSSFRTCYNTANASACSINDYNPTMVSGYTQPFSLTRNYFQFGQSGGNPSVLFVTGTFPCGGINASSSNRVTFLEGRITITRNYPIIFETLPKESNPDIYYENHLSFPINSLGEHQGNVQNQVISTNTPAIIDTGFFNCFSFGNGAESYKVRDSLIGNTFNLGNRTTSVSAQDYKRADRYADITYSGIYNNETNVNKLNEFNLGLLNFKPLEDSFGDIYILDGRETDVLVLQEDRISYVLTGKNLLSDAAAGGAITSIPEVLGTQIARVEKYGISFNPESYINWGYDRYFTDAKRGTVLQLKGDSLKNDQLKVVSEQGMRTWFRDEFIDTFNTQKLGGFDPYMNEYVLSINDRDITVRDDDGCIDCGTTQTFVLFGEEESIALEYCVDLGPQTGLVTLTWTVLSGTTGPLDGFDISLTYDGNTITSGFITTSGTLSFTKDSITEELAQVSVSMTGNFTISMSMSCPFPEEMTIVEIVLTNDTESGQTTYAQYRYANGSYTSPLQSRFVTFASGTSTPLVSWYNSVSGVVGTGGFPPAGSTMRMYNNKIAPTATFNFNPIEDKFRYYRSNTLYANNSVDLNNLIGVSTIATPIFGTSPINYADFIVPPTGNYLYLIWDYRTTTPNGLCYGPTQDDVCCNCEACEESACITVNITNPSPDFYAAVTFNGGICNEGVPMSIELEPEETVTICVVNTTPLYSVVFGNPIVTTILCECATLPCYYHLKQVNPNVGYLTDGLTSANLEVNPIVPTSSHTFAGWTIDGLDFITNYASVMASYGVEATMIYECRLAGGSAASAYTVSKLIVSYTGFSVPPSSIGFIQDSFGNTVEYAWSEPVCEWGCATLNYDPVVFPTTTVLQYLEMIGVVGVTTYINISLIDTFGYNVDITDPIQLDTLEYVLRSIYGNQVVVSTVINGITGYTDIVINNIPQSGVFRFYNPTISGSQNRWLGIPSSCTTPPLCSVNLDYSDVQYDGALPEWVYVTNQISGINMPITLAVEWDQTLYPSPCFTIYYRIDTVAPTFAFFNDPLSQGCIEMVPDYSNRYILPAINSGEYLTLVASGVNLCGFSNETFVPISIRNETPSCYGELVEYFEAHIIYS